jgi:hypothetical protein
VKCKNFSNKWRLILEDNTLLFLYVLHQCNLFAGYSCTPYKNVLSNPQFFLTIVFNLYTSRLFRLWSWYYQWSQEALRRQVLIPTQENPQGCIWQWWNKQWGFRMDLKNCQSDICQIFLWDSVRFGHFPYDSVFGKPDIPVAWLFLTFVNQLSGGTSNEDSEWTWRVARVIAIYRNVPKQPLVIPTSKSE